MIVNKRVLLERILNIYSYLAYTFNSHYPFYPLLITFEPTMRCNLRCKMCPFYGKHGTPPNKKEEMTVAQIKKMFDDIADTYKFLPFKPFIAFTGGEVFIRQDIFEILDHLNKRGFRYSLTTNFSLPDMQDRIAKLASLKPTDVRISLDGPGEIHDTIRGVKGTFARAINNIQILRKLNPQIPIRINCVVSNYNIIYLKKMVNIAKLIKADLNFQHLMFLDKDHIETHQEVMNRTFQLDLPVRTDIYQFNEEQVIKIIKNIKGAKERTVHLKVNLTFTPNVKDDELKKYYLDLENYTHSNKCTYPWLAVRINPAGRVYPCLEYYYGDLKKDKFADVWNNEKAKQFKLNLRKAKLFPGCIHCCKI